MISRSPEETKKIAAELAATLKGGEVILLHGELGAGKTTFVQGLCEALGCALAKSPTFTIMNEHKIDGTNTTHVKKILHLDFYRTASAHGLGLEEMMGKTDTLTVMEWPPADLALPTSARVMEVALSAGDGDTRNIEIF